MIHHATVTTLSHIWDTCHRADWMLRMASEAEIQLDERALRLFSCWCAEKTPGVPKPKDPRSKNAIRIAKLYADGLIGEAALCDAWYDARMAVKDFAIKFGFRRIIHNVAACAASSASRPYMNPKAASATYAEASMEAEDFAYMWAYTQETNDEKDHDLVDVMILMPNEKRKIAEQAQADELRKVIGNPFTNNTKKYMYDQCSGKILPLPHWYRPSHTFCIAGTPNYYRLGTYVYSVSNSLQKATRAATRMNADDTKSLWEVYSLVQGNNQGTSHASTHA